VLGGDATDEGFFFDVSASTMAFEGATPDAYETTLSVTDPTADRAITFPNVSGTVVTTGDTGSVTNLMLAGSIAASKLVGTDIATVGTITSGTWNGSTIGVAYGGTGATTFAANGVLYGNGTSAVSATAAGTAGQLLVAGPTPAFVSMSGDATITSAGVLTVGTGAVTGAKIANATIEAIDLESTNTPELALDDYILSYDHASGGFTWIANSGGSGASKWTDAGTFTHLTSLSDDLVLGGDATDEGFFFDVSASTMAFEGATPDAYETTLSVTDPTADHTVNLPNESGTVCTTGSVCSGYQASITNPVTGTGATNQIAYWSGANAISGITVSNSSFLTTNGSGVPGLTAISSDTFTQYALLAGRSGGQTLVGGTGVTDVLKLQGTSGDGTLTSPAIQMLVGNNGATTALTVLNNGKVGIGTTSPDAELDVYSNNTGMQNFLKFASSQTSFTFEEGAGSGGAPTIRAKGLVNSYSTLLVGDGVNDTGSNPLFRISGRINNGTVSTRPLFDIANVNDPKFTVSASGNVGIGTTSPVSVLHVKVSSGSSYSPGTNNGGLFFENNGSSPGYFVFQLANANKNIFNVANNGSVFIQSNAFVGYGSSSLTSASGKGQLAIHYDANNYGNFYVDSSGNMHVSAVGAFDVANTAGNSLMYVNSTGNVGIGTTSPAQKLDIASGNIRVDNTTYAAQYGVLYKGSNRFLHNFNYGLNGNGITTDGGNLFLGENAGNFTMGNTATQTYQASYNTGIGLNVLSINTIGNSNAGLGTSALLSNTTGNSNSAIGVSALRLNSSGSFNTAIGVDALRSNTTGYQNSAVGVDAGHYLADGSTGNTTGNNSLFLGYDTRANGAGQTNQIVIGASAIGLGSNTVVLGNDSIVTTALRGNVGINTSAPDRRLDVLDASNPQLRLTHTDGTVYTDFQTTSGGDLTITPSGGDTRVAGTFGIQSGSYATIFQAGAQSADITYTLPATSANGVLRNTSGTLSWDTASYPTGTGAAGYIPYWSSSSALTYDSDGFFWDATNNRLGIGTTSPTYQFDIKGTSTLASLGSEMILALADQDMSDPPSGNWTGTNWIIGSGRATHTAGANTFSLSNAALSSAPALGHTYQISFSVNTTTAGTLNIAIGSTSYGALSSPSGTHTILITAGGSGALTFTPSAAWAGYVDDISVKEATASDAMMALHNTDSSVALEFRGASSSTYGTFLGYQSGRFTTGSTNSFVGYQSGASNTTGTSNAAFGYQSLYRNTTGFSNVASGYRSLYQNTTGNNNVAVGYQALTLNTSGYNNAAFGSGALGANTEGYYDVAVGSSALASNTTGGNNSGIGFYSLYTNTTGSSNAAFGSSSLRRNDTGSSNAALGSSSGYYNATGSDNVFVGYQSGFGSSGASNISKNTMIGSMSGAAVLTGSDNGVMIGYRAGDHVTAGAGNILMGYQAGNNITSGGTNILIGYDIDAQSATTDNQLSIGNLIFATGGFGTGTTVGAGNVGIGDTSPDSLLDISSSGTAATQFSITNTNAGDYDSQLSFQLADNTNLFTMGVDDSDSDKFKISTTALGTNDRFVIDSTGNVGINTSAPDRRLDVLDASNPQLRLTHTDGTVYTDFQTTSGGDLTITPSGGDTRVAGTFGIQNGSYTTIFQAGAQSADITYTLPATSANGVLRNTSGTLSWDTSTYLTANQSITLSGDISGTGTTAITTTIGADKITESMLKAVNTATDEYCLTYETTTGDFEWQACGGGGMAIGSAVGSGTSGSVLFVNDSGNLAQDNANFFWDAGNARLGIGTASPLARLHVLGTTEQLRLGYDASNYLSATVSSAGTVTFDAIGSSQGFSFADALTVTGNILPSANETYNLGATGSRWNDLYLGGETIHLGTSATDEATISYASSNILSFGTDSTTNGDIAFFTDDLYLDKSSGYVGINTTAPSDRFHLKGGTLRVDTPATPTLTGTYNTSGAAYGVAVAGRYAYVADFTAGLHIIDISNPASPTLVGTYNTSGNAYGVAVSGRYAYVADHSSGLQIIDISNPASPTLVGTYNTSGEAYGVAVSGRYAYVADYTEGFHIIDISNPASPSLVGTYDMAQSARGVAVAGGYAYVADDISGLHIIDISNPASPTLVGTYNTSGEAYGVAVSGRYAYVADYTEGFHIIDISNPVSPTRVGTYDTAGAAYGVAVAGRYAYVAYFNEGLRIIDVVNPASPSLVGTYDTSGTAYGVTVAGRYAYVADFTAGLRIIDIGGTDTHALVAGETETDFLSVNGNAQVAQNLSVNGGLSVGPGGILSQGAGSVYANGANTAFTVTQYGTGDILNLFDGATEVLTVLDGGNVGIGDSTPDYRLDVEADAATSYAASIFNDGDDANRYGLLIQSGADSGGTGTLVQFMDGDGTDVGEITFNGTTTTYSTSSDRRLKDDIRDTHYTLADLNRVQVRDYEFTEDGMTSTGFIAQELYDIFPYAVSRPDDPDRMWGVDYGKITPLIVSAVQELSGVVDDQQDRYEALESRFADLSLGTDENISTLGELQASVDGQLLVVGDALSVLGAETDALDGRLTTVEGQVLSLESAIADLVTADTDHKAGIAALESDMADLREGQAALMDFYANFELGSVAITDADGSLDLLDGTLSAKIVETGELVIEVRDPDAKTIGTATILPAGTDEDGSNLDGRSVFVPTSAVSDTARIFVTFEGDPGASYWVEKNEKDGEYVGFTVRLSEPIGEEVSLDWLLVTEE
ncbi:MAG: hypothetical protein HGB37_04155, partial [Candidatus Moranbacteria bacterium]|nr:hypothetical protein [Candidatus Moranbacteria bacterium]